MEQAGGGWYGGGGAGNYDGSFYNESAGGGGGSGFVWTSGTASNVPSGYSVGTQYYLTDAATYGGNTSFTSTSGGTETGHSGDGYARITLLSATKTTQTEVTTNVTRWINIEKQKANGTLTGNFDYGSYYIKETDSNGTLVTHNG